MQQVTAFMASDKTLFPTAELCEEHEYSLKWRNHIHAFIATPDFPYKTGSYRGMVIKVLTNWERYKAHLSLLPE